MRPIVIYQEKYLLIHGWPQLAFPDDFPFRAISQAAYGDKRVIIRRNLPWRD